MPVSLKVSLRSSPFSRLMPLKDESCEVVVICAMIPLYCATRDARVFCELRRRQAGSHRTVVDVPEMSMEAEEDAGRSSIGTGLGDGLAKQRHSVK